MVFDCGRQGIVTLGLRPDVCGAVAASHGVARPHKEARADAAAVDKLHVDSGRKAQRQRSNRWGVIYMRELPNPLVHGKLRRHDSHDCGRKLHQHFPKTFSDERLGSPCRKDEGGQDDSRRNRDDRPSSLFMHCKSER